LENAKDGIVRPYRIPLRMTDTALVGGICVDIRKSMSRFVDAYVICGMSLPSQVRFVGCI
ncbi:hypothetical protein, partial [Vibrio toranzoniae]|uniref:hypothetical protein n=1 Tax=Vibrio toranzoniae TaxID=1194427 RepID=UPI001ABF04EE